MGVSNRICIYYQHCSGDEPHAGHSIPFPGFFSRTFLFLQGYQPYRVSSWVIYAIKENTKVEARPFDGASF